MSQFVPYLDEEAIERDSMSLLAEYEHARGVIVEPPVPVEDIIEKHLKLRIEFDDMHALHNVPRPASGEADILGAIYGDGSIFIDESLDPEEHPSKEGRYRFTLAHEGGGHWRLHQHLIIDDQSQTSFFDDTGGPKFICRSSQAKAREEWQADFYASCLLMPRNLIVDAWIDLVPDGGIRSIREGSRAALFAPVNRDPIPRSVRCSSREVECDDQYTISVPFNDFWRVQEVMDAVSDSQALERFCKPLAERFAVSPIAMRIRLEKLGRLHLAVPLQQVLADE